jgi:hypothetical protein
MYPPHLLAIKICLCLFVCYVLVVCLPAGVDPAFSREITVRHGYLWVPTDQAHGRLRQVGPTYQKTHRLDS